MELTRRENERIVQALQKVAEMRRLAGDRDMEKELQELAERVRRGRSLGERYVIQTRVRVWDKWEIIGERKYETIEDAQRARDALTPMARIGSRIAEEYTVTSVRYREVRGA